MRILVIILIDILVCLYMATWCTDRIASAINDNLIADFYRTEDMTAIKIGHIKMVFRA